MDTLRQDLVYSLRSLLRAPRFTAVAIVTLALGVGATSAIFSVVDAVLLRPLPFPGARQVVNLTWEADGYLQELSAIKFQYWRDHARSFAGMATWRSELVRIEARGEATAVRALGVTSDFFAVLGYVPAHGRGFRADEHVPGGPPAAIVSAALWRDRLATAADVVGRPIRLNGESFTIVGVLPESFVFPYESGTVDVIVPLALAVDPDDIAENWTAIARLRADVTREQAGSEVVSLTAPFRAAYPKQVSGDDRGMKLATFSELRVAGGVRRALWILMGGVTLVLLIACANVANLFLVRAARRRGEIALRSALGGSRWRITRLVLTESLIVALAAGTLGLLLGNRVAGALVALTPIDVPRMTAPGLDGRVILFTGLVSLATSVLFGAMAAWPAARARLSEALKESGRASSGRSRMRQGLLAVQAALAMMLLAGAGLLVMTLIHLTRVDPGFDAEGLVAARLPSKPPGYETSGDLSELQRRVAERLNGSPFIESIAGASSLPLERGINTPMTIRGRPDVAGTVEWRAVTPGYFRTLGISLSAGRGFADTDLAGRPPVAIVNEAFARRYFRDGSPLGEALEVGRMRGKPIDPSRAAPPVEVVGIAADILEMSLRAEPRPTIYVPQAQAPDFLSNVRGTMPVFIARARTRGGDVARALGDALRAADPALPGPEVLPLADVVARSLARERFGASLLSTLAALALALTAFGIYGVLAYTVQQRRREIGIRMALGATRGQVTRLVMVEGIAPVLTGLVLGLAGSLALSRLVAAYLWAVAPADPATLASVAAMLLGAALVASAIPAREAADLDPVRTLACE